MFSLVVSDEYAGKTLFEMISIFRDSDCLKQKLGHEYTETSCIVTLDGEIIVYTSFDSIKLNAGQLIKIFPLTSGG